MESESLNLLFKSVHTTALMLGAIVGLVGTILTYWRTNPQTPKFTRFILGFLRFLGWTGIIFLLADAVLVSLSKKQVKPSVVILVDISESMEITDKFGSRQDAVQSFIKSPEINTIKSANPVINYTFAESLCPWGMENYHGKATAIGNALLAIADSSSNIEISSVILVSDGQNNWGVDPLSISATLPFPVFCVGVGDTTPSPDIIVEQVSAPNVAYTGEELPIVAYVQSWYPGEKMVSVELIEGKKTISKQQVSLSGRGQINEIQLRYTPSEDGTKYYTVYVPPIDIEATKENNSRTVAVRVLSSRRKMLIVCDHPSWEVAFFRRTFENDPHMDVNLLIPRGGDIQLNRIPSDSAKLNEFNIVVLIHAENLLTADAIKALRQYVLSGGAILWFCQGEFTMPASAAELFSEIMPVRVPSRPKFSYGEFTPSLQANAINNPVMKFDGNWEQILPELPPLNGINVFELNEDAQVLLKHPSTGVPVLATRQTRGGRTAIVTSGPLWRWSIVPFGFGKNDKPYRTLITNLVSYLVASERIERVVVNTGKKVYRSGEPVVITASVRDEANHPVSDASVGITVVGENDSFSIELQLSDDGIYKTLLPSLEPGQYRISATANKGGQNIGKSSTDIIVEQFQFEFARTYQDKTLLTELAKLSGGKYLPINSASEIASLLPSTTRTKTQTSEFQLRNSPWILLVVVVSLTMEWILRKRANLI